MRGGVEGGDLPLAAASQQQLVLFRPDPMLHALHQKEATFRLAWAARDGFRPPETITLEQGGRGTGAVMWQAGYLLAQFIAMHGNGAFALLPPEFRNPPQRQWQDAVCVELGAGLGLVSIVAGMLGAEVCATDGEDTVVQQLAQNAQRYTAHTPHKITTAVLRWSMCLCVTRLACVPRCLRINMHPTRVRPRSLTHSRAHTHIHARTHAHTHSRFVSDATRRDARARIHTHIHTHTHTLSLSLSLSLSLTNTLSHTLTCAHA